MDKLKEDIKNYILVFRFSRVGGFIQTFLGMLAVSFFTKTTISIDNYIELLKVVIIFGLFMYSGLFGLNNYFDRNRDKQSNITKNRVLPSGKLKAQHVLFLSLTLLSFSFVCGIIFLPYLIFVQTIFIVTNLVYSIFLKDTDRLVAAMAVHITQPMRFLVGVLVMGADPSQYIGFYLLIWIITVVSATYKIKLLKEEYPTQRLNITRKILMFFGFLIAIELFAKHNNIVFYIYFVAGVITFSNIFKKNSLYTSLFWKK